MRERETYAFQHHRVKHVGYSYLRGALCRIFRALLRICEALWRIHRALLQIYRTLLQICRAVLCIYRALTESGAKCVGAF